MSIRNLLLTGLAICTMAGCSNDDENIVDPNATFDASINVGCILSSNPMTKTSTEDDPEVGIAGESNVRRLTAFVFDASNKCVVAKDFSNSNENIGEVKDIVVKATTSGTAYKLFLVANLDNEALLAIDKYADIDAITSSLVNQSGTKLTMTSKVLDITVKGSATERIYDNYLLNTDGSSIEQGETGKGKYDNLINDNKVPLYRLPARVQLEKLSVDFKGGNLEGAKFKLGSVFMVNVKPNSKFIGDNLMVGNVTGQQNYWCAIDAFTTKDHLICPDENARITNPVYSKEYQGKEITKGSPIDFTTGGADMLQCYVFENGSANYSTGFYSTRLVIKGEIILATGQSLGDSYYHIELKNTDATGKYVVRNTIYKVVVTLTGTGAKEPDGESDENAGIAVSITPAPWKVILQNEEDQN